MSKTQPRYSMNYRFTEDVKKALAKIQKDKKIKYRNDAVSAAVLTFADGITHN